MLCPRILTTVSEELEVDELTSFTMSPGKVGSQAEVRKVILNAFYSEFAKSSSKIQ